MNPQNNTKTFGKMLRCWHNHLSNLWAIKRAMKTTEHCASISVYFDTVNVLPNLVY